MTFYCRYNFSTPPTDNTAIHYLSLGLSRLCVAGIGLLWAGRGGVGGSDSNGNNSKMCGIIFLFLLYAVQWAMLYSSLKQGVNACTCW